MSIFGGIFGTDGGGLFGSAQNMSAEELRQKQNAWERLERMRAMRRDGEGRGTVIEGEFERIDDKPKQLR